MNKIVRSHYPVEKLPQDLRDQLDPSGTVKITLEIEAPDQRRRTREDVLADVRSWEGTLTDDGVDSVTRIRSLRDEWDR